MALREGVNLAAPQSLLFCSSVFFLFFFLPWNNCVAEIRIEDLQRSGEQSFEGVAPLNVPVARLRDPLKPVRGFFAVGQFAVRKKI